MRLLKAATILALTAALSITASAQSWQQVGPPGGDVRSLTADPRDARVLYLARRTGTSSVRRTAARAGSNWAASARRTPWCSR